MGFYSLKTPFSFIGQEDKMPPKRNRRLCCHRADCSMRPRGLSRRGLRSRPPGSEYFKIGVRPLGQRGQMPRGTWGGVFPILRRRRRAEAWGRPLFPRRRFSRPSERRPAQFFAFVGKLGAAPCLRGPRPHPDFALYDISWALCASRTAARATRQPKKTPRSKKKRYEGALFVGYVIG